MMGEQVREPTKSNAGWIKIVGYLVAGAFAVAGWIYAGVMSQYTNRIVRLEATAEINRGDIRALQIQNARYEVMFKSIEEKLDAIIKAHTK